MINKKSEKTVCSEQRLLATDSQFNARKSGALRSSLSKSGATKRQQVESIESNVFDFAPRSKTCGVKNFKPIAISRSFRVLCRSHGLIN